MKNTTVDNILWKKWVFNKIIRADRIFHEIFFGIPVLRPIHFYKISYFGSFFCSFTLRKQYFKISKFSHLNYNFPFRLWKKCRFCSKNDQIFGFFMNIFDIFGKKKKFTSTFHIFPWTFVLLKNQIFSILQCENWILMYIPKRVKLKKYFFFDILWVFLQVVSWISKKTKKSQKFSWKVSAKRNKMYFCFVNKMF